MYRDVHELAGHFGSDEGVVDVLIHFESTFDGVGHVFDLIAIGARSEGIEQLIHNLQF